MRRRVFGARPDVVITDGPELPVLERHQLEALEALYPPRCRTLDESERQHDRYAGKAELVAYLRARFEENLSEDAEHGGDTFDARDGERAT